MSQVILDGKAVAKSVHSGLKGTVQELSAKLGRSPGLAVVLVGENPASQVYVRSKSKKARACGIEPTDVTLPADVSQEELEGVLQKLSADPCIDGILLQLPLPDGLQEFSALMAIDPKKDVDGLHPVNQGLLARGEKTLQACTPLGCIVLIDEARNLLGKPQDISGLHAVVVGRSILVGKPVAQMLLERNCTVTVCHSRTKNLKEECRRADILVAAVGRAEMITGDFIKPGAIVIDVGINRTEEGNLVGDVHYESASAVAGAITPVPGGVGPMTIAMLLRNTVQAAESGCSG